MKKKMYSYIIAVSVMAVSILLQCFTSLSVSAEIFSADKRSLEVQVVPCSYDEYNGWSSFSAVREDEVTHLRLALQDEGKQAESDPFDFIFMSYKGELESDELTFSVTFENTRIECADGTIIPLNGFDDTWEKPAKGELMVCNVNTPNVTVGDTRNGFFCTDATLSCDEASAGIIESSKTLPKNNYWISKNTLTLADLAYDGALTITGGKSNSEVNLIIRGDCLIESLTVDCKVNVKRNAYGSLKCGSLKIGSKGGLSYDTEYNATRLVNDGNGALICFDDMKSEELMTQGELDEKSGKYDYDWRNRNAAWYRQALYRIEQSRTADLALTVKDKNGVIIPNAEISLNQTDFDYGFGSGWDPNFGSLEALPSNFQVSYTGFLWDLYDPSNPGVFDFSKSQWGNSTYVMATVEYALEQKGITTAAQMLVYPSFEKLHHNTVSSEVFDKTAAYVLSDEYTPAGFEKLIEEHIADKVTEYAGTVREWAVSNEAYYFNDFFRLIYGNSGEGVSKEEIAAVIEKAGRTNASNNEKIDALNEYLNCLELIPAKAVAQILARFAETAQAAWNKTITKDCGYTSEDLILYYNDACYKNDTSPYEVGHYEYYLAIATELAKDVNYPSAKALITRVGLQMADAGTYEVTPQLIGEMMDELATVGQTVLVTEFNSGVDHPIASEGYDTANYGSNCFTEGCYSQTEKEFIYDYAYYMLTMLYSKTNTEAFASTSYPSGQIGLTYFLAGVTPVGEAYRQLVGREWYTERFLTSSAKGKATADGITRGSYAVKVTVDGYTYEQEIEVSADKAVTITLDKSLNELHAKGYEFTDTATNSVLRVTNAGQTANGKITGAQAEYVCPHEKAAKATIPASVTLNGVKYKITAVAADAFRNNKKLTSITIGKYVKTIGSNAFYGCAKLTSVTLGVKVSTIGEKAFAKCISLTKIALPSAVTKIGANAFNGCKNLKLITISSTKLKTVGTNAFNSVYSKAVFKTPSASLANYRKLFTEKTGFTATMKIKAV